MIPIPHNVIVTMDLDKIVVAVETIDTIIISMIIKKIVTSPVDKCQQCQSRNLKQHHPIMALIRTMFQLRKQPMVVRMVNERPNHRVMVSNKHLFELGSISSEKKTNPYTRFLCLSPTIYMCVCVFSFVCFLLLHGCCFLMFLYMLLFICLSASF